MVDAAATASEADSGSNGLFPGRVWCWHAHHDVRRRGEAGHASLVDLVEARSADLLGEHEAHPSQDLQVVFGGDTRYGAKGTEYGGYKVPEGDLLIKAPDRAFLWLTYFF